MKFFENITTLEELKRQYKKMVRRYHPDLGGSLEDMQELNAEYEQILRFGNFQDYFASENCKTSHDIEQAMREVIEKIIVLPGITIEICGTWIWITGDTFHVKEQLKTAGCKFAKRKKAWYWRSTENRTKNRKPYTMQEIRNRHGSQTIDNISAQYALN